MLNLALKCRSSFEGLLNHSSVLLQYMSVKWQPIAQSLWLHLLICHSIQRLLVPAYLPWLIGIHTFSKFLLSSSRSGCFFINAIWKSSSRCRQQIQFSSLSDGNNQCGMNSTLLASNLKLLKNDSSCLRNCVLSPSHQLLNAKLSFTDPEKEVACIICPSVVPFNNPLLFSLNMKHPYYLIFISFSEVHLHISQDGSSRRFRSNNEHKFMWEFLFIFLSINAHFYQSCSLLSLKNNNFPEPKVLSVNC